MFYKSLIIDRENHFRILFFEMEIIPQNNLCLGRHAYDKCYSRHKLCANQVLCCEGMHPDEINVQKSVVEQKWCA